MQLVGSYTFSAKYDFIKVKYMITKNISLKSLCRNILVKLKKGGGGDRSKIHSCSARCTNTLLHTISQDDTLLL